MSGSRILCQGPRQFMILWPIFLIQLYHEVPQILLKTILWSFRIVRMYIHIYIYIHIRRTMTLFVHASRWTDRRAAHVMEQLPALQARNKASASFSAGTHLTGRSHLDASVGPKACIVYIFAALIRPPCWSTRPRC